MTEETKRLVPRPKLNLVHPRNVLGLELMVPLPVLKDVDDFNLNYPEIPKGLPTSRPVMLYQEKMEILKEAVKEQGYDIVPKGDGTTLVKAVPLGMKDSSEAFTFEKTANAVSKGYYQAITKMTTDIVMWKVKQGESCAASEEDSRIHSRWVAVNEEKRIKENESTEKFLFLTVNPDPAKLDEGKITRDQKYREFFEVCKRFLGHTWIRVAHMVMEQRSTDNGIRGLHSHFLIYLFDDLNKKWAAKGDVKKDVYRTFENYVGNKRHCDMRFVVQEEARKVFNYMCGVKQDSIKTAKVQIDRKMRVFFSWDHMYHVRKGHSEDPLFKTYDPYATPVDSLDKLYEDQGDAEGFVKLDLAKPDAHVQQAIAARIGVKIPLMPPPLRGSSPPKKPYSLIDLVPGINLLN